MAVNLQTAAFEKLIKRITIESAYGPKIVLDKPFEGPSTVSPLMRRLRPRVTLEITGFQPMVSQPYGAPPPTLWPVLASGGVVVGAAAVLLAAIGAYRLVRG